MFIGTKTFTKTDNKNDEKQKCMLYVHRKFISTRHYDKNFLMMQPNL